MNRRGFLGSVSVSSFVLAGCVSTGSEAEAGRSGNETDGEEMNQQFSVREPKPGDAPQNGHHLSPPKIEFVPAKQQVIVTGYMEVGNSCKTVALQEATYKPETATVDVEIVDAMRDGAGGTCAAAMYSKVYEATFTFQNILPEMMNVHVNNVYDQELTATASKSNDTTESTEECEAQSK